jgi:putative thioredoxin
MSISRSAPEWVFAARYEDFRKRVLDVSQQHPVLVDFWAEWCSPCLVIAPVLERVIAEYAGAVLLARFSDRDDVQGGQGARPFQRGAPGTVCARVCGDPPAVVQPAAGPLTLLHMIALGKRSYRGGSPL